MDRSSEHEKKGDNEFSPLVNIEDKRINDNIKKFKAAFIAFIENPKDLVYLFTLLFLVTYSFATITSSITLYFTDIWGASDLLSGIIIGLYGVMTAIASFFTGSFPFKFGIKTSITIGGILMACGLIVIAFSNSYTLSIISLFTITAIGNSLALPITLFAIKLYTPNQSRIITNSFSVIAETFTYIFLGVVISIFWEIYFDDLEWAYSSIFLSGAVASLIAALLINFVGESPFLSTQTNKKERELGHKDVYRTRRFWKFVLFVLILTILFGVFNMFSITLGKYMTRELGQDVNWGSIFSIVSVVMILSIITFSLFLFVFSSFILIVWGLLICSLSFYFLTLPSSYAMCCLFAIFYAIGQSLFQPRLYDYIFNVAPIGQESSYFALLVFPNNFSFLLAGLMSGLLLEAYCPAGEEQEKDCWKVWIIACAFAVPTALFLFVARSYIETPPIEQNSD